MSCSRQWCNGFAVVIVLFLFGLSACATIAQEVVLKPTAGKAGATDVYLKDPETGKLIKFLTLNGVYQGGYHPAEYRNGYLYVIKRQGQTNAFDTNTDYTDELWRYSAKGEGKKLWSVQGLDFRVNNNGSRIAVTGYPDKTSGIELYIINSTGVRIKSYPKADLNAAGLTFGGWVGSDLWMKDQEAVDIYGLIQINTNTFKAQIYDLSDLELMDSDLSFNPKSMKLAYSDYPVLFDTDSEADFLKARTPVKLWVYDLKTQNCKPIAKSTAKLFNPKWVDDSTLLFDSPKGKGKMKVSVK